MIIVINALYLHASTAAGTALQDTTDWLHSKVPSLVSFNIRHRLSYYQTCSNYDSHAYGVVTTLNIHTRGN